jgi:hypothetical protein
VEGEERENRLRLCEEYERRMAKMEDDVPDL